MCRAFNEEPKKESNDDAFFSSVTVIKRNKEVDVATGDIRIVILLHERHGEKFLWPVLRRRPSDNNAEGILGG